jgi:hypothetical protein
VIPPALRKQLSQMCRSRRTREADFSEEAPCEWTPTAVTDPATGTAFTDEGAWTFIADLLDKGHHVDIVTLRKPAGKTGYVMIAQGVPARAQIYIKLQMLGNRVRGRSFHISNTNAPGSSAVEKKKTPGTRASAGLKKDGI